jgi:hypothetical protein
MSSRPIDPTDLSSSQIRTAIEQLPEGVAKGIQGVAKHPAPLSASQSPEAVRKANLRQLKAERRDLVASLIALDVEIFKLEDADYNHAMTPVAIRAHVTNSLRAMAIQAGRNNFSLTDLRETFPHEGITFATWVSELTALHRERIIFFSEEKIVLMGEYRKSITAPGCKS